MIPQAIINSPRWRLSGLRAIFTPKTSSNMAAIIVIASAADAIVPKT